MTTSESLQITTGCSRDMRVQYIPTSAWLSMIVYGCYSQIYKQCMIENRCDMDMFCEPFNIQCCEDIFSNSQYTIYSCRNSDVPSVQPLSSRYRTLLLSLMGTLLSLISRLVMAKNMELSSTENLTLVWNTKLFREL